MEAARIEIDTGTATGRTADSEEDKIDVRWAERNEKKRGRS